MTTDLVLSGTAMRKLGVSHTALLRITERCDLPLAGRTAEGFRLYRAADVERVATERAGRALVAAAHRPEPTAA